MNSATPQDTINFSELREELGRLRQFGQRLSQRLMNSIRLMQETGQAPSSDLMEELQAYRQRMHRLAGLLQDAKPSNGSSASNPRGREEISLDDLESKLDGWKRIDLAESIRTRLAELAHVDIEDFAPLSLCLQEAVRLCQLARQPVVTDEAHELDVLGEQRHPLNSLLRLAEHADELSDVEWTESYDNVATTYGRQLATALTRGRIRRVVTSSVRSVAAPTPVAATSVNDAPQSTTSLSADPNPSLTLPTSRPEPCRAEQAPSNPRSMPVSTSISHNESVFDITEIGPSDSRVRALSSASTIAKDSTSIRGPVTPTRVPPSVVGTQRSPVDARLSESASRVEHLTRQFNHLLSTDRLSLAHQLTRCAELRPEPELSLPPSWLIRALLLGRNLSYSKGEVVRQLEDELRNIRPDQLNGEGSDRSLAMGILIRAAALPAALLSGSAIATSVLRTFKITPGFSQLYNYCSRIALYGDRLGGNLVEMFHPTGAISGASELEVLARTAQSWLQEASKKAVTYARSSPLFLHAHWTLTSGSAVRNGSEAQIWCKWQETLLIAQRLLRPVCEGLDGERNWVRQEITRLTAHVYVASTEQPSKYGATGAGRGIWLPREEMQAVLQEAIGIANRWLCICSQAGPGGAFAIPIEALELREEILQRTDAVLAELIQLRRTTSSRLVESSIACLLSTVRQIQLLFEAKVTLPVAESDPRHVLNADLLRIPGVDLNEQWQTDAEPAAFERELLDSLEQPELGWRQAFDMHAHAGNHEATGRILELAVWTPDERAALHVVRDKQIADTRSALTAELTELISMLEVVADAYGHAPLDRTAYAQRLDALLREIPRVLNFCEFRHRLGRIQTALQTHRIPQPGKRHSPSIPSESPQLGLERGDLGMETSLSESNTNRPYAASVFDSANIFSGE